MIKNELKMNIVCNKYCIFKFVIKKLTWAAAGHVGVAHISPYTFFPDSLSVS
jgi:hypothetical protein